MCFRIVGEDDGGIFFIFEEYEDYKKRVLFMRMYRFFVSWIVFNGMDCKMIGLEMMCFCNYRYNYKMLKLILNVEF